MFAVFDSFFRAAADTSHTVGAVTAPERLSGLDADVVQHAAFGAVAAAGASFSGMEFFVRNNHFIKSLVDYAAF